MASNESDQRSSHSVHGQVDGEKAEVDHISQLDVHSPPVVYGVDIDELPKGYFTSSKFLGSYVAGGLNLMSSTGGFALIAPVLSQINAAIGPSTSIYWISLVYILGLAIGLLLVGRISDIFGRRWFVIGGVGLGLVGSIICSTANSVPVLIGGQTLIGLSASTGYSYGFIVGELVPIKYRFFVCSTLFIFSYPTAGFGAAVSTAFILYTKAGWRWAYYLLIILNGLTLLAYALFYYPPTFRMKHGNDSKLLWLKHFDFVGTFLYISGLLFFLMGLQWGGSAYPWKDAHVIGTIIVGVLCLIAFFVWESYAKLKEPLIPMYLFRDRGWVASALLLSLGAIVYYAFAIVWPQLAVLVYSDGRQMWAGWVSCLVGIGITTGELVGGMAAEKVGKTKYQCMAAMTIGGTVLAASAVCTPDNPKTAMALVMLATFAVGYNEALCLPICTICIRNQRDIGAAAGAAGSIRSAISTVGSTIYVVVLTNRLGVTIPSIVPPAVVAAGLPPSSVPAYMAAAAAGSAAALEKVAGITPGVVRAGARAFQVAYSDAYRTIFYTSIAFSVIAVGVSCFVPNVEDLLTTKVATTLHKRGEEVVDEKMVEHLEE